MSPVVSGSFNSAECIWGSWVPWSVSAVHATAWVLRGLLICSPVEGQLGWWQFLAVVYKAVPNISILLG